MRGFAPHHPGPMVAEIRRPPSDLRRVEPPLTPAFTDTRKSKSAALANYMMTTQAFKKVFNQLRGFAPTLAPMVVEISELIHRVVLMALCLGTKFEINSCVFVKKFGGVSPPILAPMVVDIRRPVCDHLRVEPDPLRKIWVDCFKTVAVHS
jgi:hypothetical protein